MNLDVSRARPGDVDEIVDVLSEAARWLLSRGIVQWPDPFPRARVARLVDRGDFRVARADGETVGVLALLWSDPAFWGERPDDAGYVHALAVRRPWAGRGVGAQLLEWADGEVEAAGRSFLRLDCLAGNGALAQVLRAARVRAARGGRGGRLHREPLRTTVPAVSGGRSAILRPPAVACALRLREPRGRRASCGQIVADPAQSGHRHVRCRRLRSQRERGWPEHPTQGAGTRAS